MNSINELFTEVNRRTQGAFKAFFALVQVFRSRVLSTRLKANLYKVMVRPILLYGCESWSLTSVLERKLQVAENRMLRWITGPVYDHKRGFWKGRPNAELREKCSINLVSSEISARRLQWAGHVARMDERRAPRVVMEARVAGRRSRGRPRKRWMDLVRHESLEQGVVAWKVVAQDRPRWRQVVKTAKGLTGS